MVVHVSCQDALRFKTACTLLSCYFLGVLPLHCKLQRALCCELLVSCLISDAAQGTNMTIFLFLFRQHYDAVMQYISDGPMLLDVHMHKPTTRTKSFMDALLAFWPGLQVRILSTNRTQRMLCLRLLWDTFLFKLIFLKTQPKPSIIVCIRFDLFHMVNLETRPHHLIVNRKVIPLSALFPLAIRRFINTGININ